MTNIGVSSLKHTHARAHSESSWVQCVGGNIHTTHWWSLVNCHMRVLKAHACVCVRVCLPVVLDSSSLPHCCQSWPLTLSEPSCQLPRPAWNNSLSIDFLYSQFHFSPPLLSEGISYMCVYIYISLYYKPKPTTLSENKMRPRHQRKQIVRAKNLNTCGWIAPK